VERQGPLTPVTLTGSGSDPEGDPISFQWTEGDKLLSTDRVLNVELPLGQHVFTLIVTDSFGGTGACSTTVDVVGPIPLGITCRWTSPSPVRPPAVRS